MAPKKIHNETAKRHAITLEDKLIMIKRHEKGEKVVAIARSFGMSRTTVSTIVHNKDKILAHIKSEAPGMKNTVINKKRGRIYEEMESLLSLWIVWLNRQRAPICQKIIQEKALSLFEELKKKYPHEKDVEFKASQGWFMRFKERRSYHSIKEQSESASAVEQAAAEFPCALKKIIEENGFLPEQIFNVNETGLYWKKLPDRSFISKEEKTIPGYKASKERVTIMLGGNCAGDFKLKPLLVYHAHNPRALKNIPKASLPVIWMANSKALVTVVVFEDWFFNHFIPAAEKYCKEKRIPFKILLILDNAPGHPQNIVDFDPNVTVVYLPPNTTSLLQPMDQGIIAIFKRYYMKHTLRQAIAATDLDESITLREFWKRYDIYKAVQNIAAAWNDVQSTAMNGVWKKLCPQFVNDFKEFDNVAINKTLVTKSKELEMDLEEEDFTDLFEKDKQPLTDEDLIELHEQQNKEEKEVEPEPRHFTIKKMQQAFAYIEKGLSMFDDMDPNAQRFSKIMGACHEALAPYNVILEEKKKKTVQGTLNQFSKRVEQQEHPESAVDAGDPQPSTSTM
ncbi:tigger transposable element-derived protein 1-like [Octopus sinensis]|uniref:Tigger transposable element-derived protein 1-like n=1 Tax=Octopus sinensis TaxID=2607531 RepID=A0A7E6F9A3_9MOLL|nr:tigger transposable element-derived protein 1-like [Octopus sinensis]